MTLKPCPFCGNRPTYDQGTRDVWCPGHTRRAEYWINSYLSLSKSRLDGISKSDYRMWLATGHRSNTMDNSRKALSLADGEE